MIKYLEGDATEPKERGKKVIMHICNDVNVWGAGFVMALSAKWPEPEADFHGRSLSKAGVRLGEVFFVEVGDDIVVANMIAQRGTAPKNGRPPIRYAALELCLEKVHDFVKGSIGVCEYSVHAPRIGCGLAGGEWSQVEAIIKRELSDKNVPVYIYDIPPVPPKQVIVMRRKYPDGQGGQRKLRTGKMIAQGAHASMAVLLNQMCEYTISDEYSETLFGYLGRKIKKIFGMADMSDDMRRWIEGKFTKICVYVDSEEELLELHEKAKGAKLPNALIKDSGATEFGGVPTYTALAIGPAAPDKIDHITGKLPLL